MLPLKKNTTENETLSISFIQRLGLGKALAGLLEFIVGVLVCQQPAVLELHMDP